MKREKMKGNIFIKKIICLALVIVMLAGNFVSPVASIAKEIKEANSNVADVINDGENNQGNDENNANSNEEKGNVSRAKSEKGTVESDAVNNEENAGEKSSSDAVTPKEVETSGEEISTSENASTKQESVSETTTESDSESTATVDSASVLKSLRNKNNALTAASNNLNAVNNAPTATNNAQSTNDKPSLDELKDRLKPLKKDDLTVKTKNDQYEINVFNIEFVSGAKKDQNNNLVWTPANSSSGHEFTFRVNYAISGLKELPAEAIKITIPKSILRNRDGNLDDKYQMSIPSIEEYSSEEYSKQSAEEKSALTYIENDDYLVIYNPAEVKAGSNGYFEVSYATKSQTFKYKDYDKTKTSTVADGGTASDPFYATIELQAMDDTLTNISDEKEVFIDTHARIVSTQKRYPTIYRNWNTSWMAEIPEDKDQYYYLIWEIKTFVEKDPTQYYNFTLEDVVKDLTEGTTGEDYEIVGYKFAGERYYNTTNTQAKQTRDENRYDYVLTRHKIDTYKQIQYTLKNTVTAIVDPIDQVDEDTKAKSSNQFFWDPGFTPPTGSFNLYKYGNNTWNEKFGHFWDYANYDLDKFQKEEISELNGLRYFTETIGYAYPWTVKEGGSLEEPADYGYNAVKYVTWDDKVFLEGDETPMTPADYYLQSFTYSITNKGAEHDDFENKFIQTSPTYEDDEKVIFYGKIDGEWKEIGKYNLKENTVEPNAEYVESMTTRKITLKQNTNCTGWKFETSNKHYYTYIVVEPTFALKNSAYVKDKAANKDSIKIQNNVSTEITDYKNKILFQKETSGIDYARVTYYDSEITKKVSSVSNNILGKNYRITWKINAWETATSGSGNAEYIRQASGQFYDLIPLGAEIDVNSIQVQTEKGFLPENEYTYKVVTNYKNSGRTMLIVNVDSQAQFYNVFYNTMHSWDSLKDFGRNILNPVAYETGNEKITNGYPDNGGELSSNNKALYINLDDTTNENKFIYTEQSYDINAVTSAVAGLYKKVKTTNDTEYSYSTEVEPDGEYTYQLRYQNTFTNKAKDLILFDSIENFKVVNPAEGTTKTSGWKGLFKAININQMVLKGIAPVVYISTEENLDLDAHNDITDASVWTKLTNETDLSTVKAIAIDMRKGLDGEDFILNPGESVSAVIHMKAPGRVTEEMKQSPYTYNNVYIKDTLIDELNGTQEFFIHQDYTQVKYRIIADVPVKKVNEENELEGIKDITFRLYGKTYYGADLDEYVTSDRNGNIKFKDIEAGEYILQEYEATPDWQEDHTEHRVEITENREVYVDDNLVTELAPAKITNKRRIHTDVSFTKRDIADKNKTLDGVKFKLSGVSDYGNEILMYGISGEDGNVKFNDVEQGTYELIEVATVDGYILNGTKYRVVVDENGNYDIQKQIIRNVPRTETEEKQVLRPKKITKYSHTPNINDEGYANSNHYGDVNDVVKIDGADYLDVIVYYSIQSDWDAELAIDDHWVTGGDLDYEYVNNNGYENVCKTYKTKVLGDTVSFELYTYDQAYYGYYAIITGNVQVEETVNNDVVIQEAEETYESVYENGNYNIYNEPYHNFYFTKKDSYNYEKLGGAKFRLYGCTNNGNTYDQTITSVEGTGYVNFENIESGNYVLKEILPPNNNETTYVVDNSEHIVEVFENGKVTLDGNTIWPLSEINNSPYEWYNSRNKGQITVTKKWIDNLDNSQRQEPTIYISTEQPQQSYTYAYFNTAFNGKSMIDYVTTSKVTSFKRNTTLSESQVLAKSGVTRVDNQFYSNDVRYKIYAWVENETYYWWTKADFGVLPANLDNYFYNEYSLKNIDWTGIYTSGYWTGAPGTEELSESITNMKNMFYGCSSIENLDISWFNNSAITNESDMEYVFGKNEEVYSGGRMLALNYITIGENFKLFSTSVLSTGNWKHRETEREYLNTSLIGNIEPGTYEFIGIPVKYAVQIYGIDQDKDENGKTLGLTFGPATGQNGANAGVRAEANYNNAYITHTYESNGDGTYKVVIVRHNINNDGTESITTKYLKHSSGNYVTRTESDKAKYDVNIHDMTWQEIADVPDKSIFTDCMLCGDTKSVHLTLNNTISSGNGQAAKGDGGLLYNTIKNSYRYWNPNRNQNSAAINGGSNGSNAKLAGAYSSSHIRATLVGANDKTDVTYAGDNNLTEETCLYNCIEDDLKAVIRSKSVKYATGPSLYSATGSTLSDPIWLISWAEMCMETGNGYTLEGTASSTPMAYQKFNNRNSNSFISLTYSWYSTQARVSYSDYGGIETWWLRSPCLHNDSEAYYVSTNGDGYSQPVRYERSLAFGFCIGNSSTKAKYAVQIYGINQDKDENGETLGLTFGPATGQNIVNEGDYSIAEAECNYNNAYITHTYESNGNGTYKVVIVRHNVNADGTETTTTKYLKNSDGNYVTRTEAEKNKYDLNIHDMTWREIADVPDKSVFTDCMLCGDTKSVQINLNSTITSGIGQSAMGDGCGALDIIIDRYYRIWNPSYNNSYSPERNNSAATHGGMYGSNAMQAGGYSSSHIRATLVGADDKTDITYAGDVNLTSDTCLYSCIEGDLKDVIANKSVKYITGENNNSATVSTVTDPIWLFSNAEMCGTGYHLEGTATSGKISYQKFNDKNSVSFTSESGYDDGKSFERAVCYERGWVGVFWLRTPEFNPNYSYYVYYSDYSNIFSGAYSYSNFGIAFGFCIK